MQLSSFHTGRSVGGGRRANVLLPTGVNAMPY